MTAIRSRPRAVLELAFRSTFRVHAGGYKRNVVKESIPAARDQVLELVLGAVERKRQRLELRRKYYLQGKVSPKTHPELHMRTQLLIGPVGHVSDEPGTIQREGHH